MEQLAARQAHNLEVGGASPPPATSKFKVLDPVAQLVEHLPFKQRVLGSSPSRIR